MESMGSELSADAQQFLRESPLNNIIRDYFQQICVEKPDRPASFIVDAIVKAYPDRVESFPFEDHPPEVREWTSLKSQYPATQRGLSEYLHSVSSREMLERLVENAIVDMPENLEYFMVDFLVMRILEPDPVMLTQAEEEATADVNSKSAAANPAPAAAAATASVLEALEAGCTAEELKEMLNNGADIDQTDPEGNTPLILAANGEAECAEVLCGAGAKLDEQNEEGTTALMAAVKYQDAQTVQLLLAAGADTSLKDKAGNTAMDYAQEEADDTVLAVMAGESLEELEALPPPPPPKLKTDRRTSVSSESIDPNQKVDLSTIPKVPKTGEQRHKIEKATANNFLFNSCDADQLTIIVDAMFEVKADSGHQIIKQGDPGDNFYILEDGHCDVFVNDSKVHEYNASGFFGELALMYNCPRAATVVATKPCVLWAMDRQTFRATVVQGMMHKRTQYEKFMGQIPLLKEMDHYEKATVADAVQEMPFSAGSDIITQGASGDAFFILSKGKAEAWQTKDGGPEMKMASYDVGDYFGELALLSNQTRASTVRAATDCACICLERKSFERLLGPVMHILKRNANEYKKYEDVAKK